MDELQERLDNLEAFIEDLQLISSDYEKLVDHAYIEEITDTWCRADKEAEELRKRLLEMEEAEMREQVREFERSRI